MTVHRRFEWYLVMHRPTSCWCFNALNASWVLGLAPPNSARRTPMDLSHSVVTPGVVEPRTTGSP